MDNKIIIRKITKVPGLYYIENIVENSEELIQKLDEVKWNPLSSNKNSRVVQHYGYKYNYTTHNINEKTTDIPDYLVELKNSLTKISKRLKIINADYEFNQCIVNNYNPGQGISRHVDIHAYGKTIGCFTLGSGCIMKFTNFATKEVHEIYTKQNSLYIMTSDARYHWTHEMPSTKTDIVENKVITRDRRISITFRNVPDFN